VIAFVQRHLSPSGRLGEALFGLIMALGFTGAVRLGRDEADNHALFIGILGCNVAWAIVDAAMYVLGELFERGRKARLFREVAKTKTDAEALGQIAAELDGPLWELASAQELEQVHRWVLAVLRREKPEPARVRGEDFLGGAAVALLIIATTFPIVVPYLLVADPNIAVRISNAVALILLFMVGVWWGYAVGGNPIRIGTGVTLLGMVLVLVTIALGG